MPYIAAILALFLSVTAFADEGPAFTVEKGIEYTKADDVSLKLDAYLPTKKGVRPGVLVIHGGSWRGGSRRQLARYARALAAEGFAAFAISYRLAPRHKHPAQIEDCRDAVRWLKTTGAKRFSVDPKRVGAIGYSAGAHLAAMLATTGVDKSKDPKGVGTRIQVAAGGGTPSDFTTLPAAWPILSYWLGDTRARQPKVYEQASPVTHVTKDDAPYFLFHGTRDMLCAFASAKRMVAKLKAAGVPTGLHVCEGKGHGGCAMDPIALDKAVTFLRTHLADQKKKDVAKTD